MVKTRDKTQDMTFETRDETRDITLETRDETQDTISCLETVSRRDMSRDIPITGFNHWFLLTITKILLPQCSQWRIHGRGDGPGVCFPR